MERAYAWHLPTIRATADFVVFGGYSVDPSGGHGSNCQELGFGRLITGRAFSVVIPDMDDDQVNQYISICKHDGGLLWRSLARTSYADAEHDRKKHAKNCPYTDNGIIQPGDPEWE